MKASLGAVHLALCLFGGGTGSLIGLDFISPELGLQEYILMPSISHGFWVVRLMFSGLQRKRFSD